MSNTFGNAIKLSVFGQSHAPAVGFTLDGIPAGFAPDFDALAAFMARRSAKRDGTTTTRFEDDKVEIVSGLVRGVTCGAPIAGIIYNNDAKSEDYSKNTVFRPSHADFTAFIKYHGANDNAGGGQFSGRLTAPLCASGGIVKQLLSINGIEISAKIKSLHGVENPDAETAKQLILDAKNAGDSIGGVIACTVTGVPAGIGEPMFDGLENKLAQAVFAIPGVRGIEFGLGFKAAEMTGSEHNDAFIFRDNKIVTETNNHGGILGGISSGMPITFNVAIKPTPSIAKAQKTVDISERKPVTITVRGRHDPCIVPRALPCVEACAALAIFDSLKEDGFVWNLTR